MPTDRELMRQALDYYDEFKHLEGFTYAFGVPMEEIRARLAQPNDFNAESEAKKLEQKIERAKYLAHPDTEVEISIESVRTLIMGFRALVKKMESQESQWRDTAHRAMDVLIEQQAQPEPDDGHCADPDCDVCL